MSIVVANKADPRLVGGRSLVKLELRPEALIFSSQKEEIEIALADGGIAHILHGLHRLVR